MIQATSSNAGKTFLCLCLCKIAKEMGIRVAPFKAQNMSNNTVIAAEGKEVSAAQWLQAISCGLLASVDMNPVIVKPKANCKSQVLVHGSIECDNYTYPGDAKLREFIRSNILLSLRRLSKRYELVIIEGSGSASEINLREYDTNNMWLASSLNCDVVLVSDIERGGALASLVGTHCLLSANELRLIKGFVINKFSGKVGLVKSGIELISNKTNWSCYGIIPWLEHACGLPSEDSLWEKRGTVNGAYVGIIIDLPYFCNYNDYTPLSIESGLSVIYIKTPPACVWDNIKFVIVPNTTCVLTGLEFVLRLGWDTFIRNARKKGVLIIGIGAGLLMLSERFSLNSTALFGLRLLKTSISICGVPLLTPICYCSVLDVSVKICVNRLIRHDSVSINSTTRTLLSSANMEYGVYDGNVWGVCVQGLFINDAFRCAFLNFLGIRPCYISYTNKINTVIAKIASDIMPNISAELLSLIRGN